MGTKCGEKKNQISVDLGRLLKWNRGGNQAWESNVNQMWEPRVGTNSGIQVWDDEEPICGRFRSLKSGSPMRE